MMNGIARVKEKVANKQLVIGSHVSFDSGFISEMIGGVGFDFVWIDGEHSALDNVDIQYHVMGCRAAGTAAFVRVPWNRIYFAKTILDMGADGIVFPMICTPEEAAEAISVCTYPPRGTRGFGVRRACNYSLDNKQEYLQTADDRMWKIIQIEHIEAVNNLEAILDVEGIDAIVVGPNDFATSMGYIGNPYGQKETRQYLERIAKVTKSRNIPLGASIGYDETAMRFWLDNGVDWLGVGTDMQYIQLQATHALKDTIAMAENVGIQTGF